ncbi:MAG: flavin reductase family protein [Thermoflexales bacterium]|nr:flavin reductase family protein [Thermoflexales bacterium]MDW8351079.1 flavin reductase family protein [Anaerolineae bacterium]
MVSPDAFKQVMRRWASTVTIITTRAGDTIYGLTATAFSSLSVNPPEVFVSINKQTRTHPLIEQGGVFCVNFLAPEMIHISDRFAGRHPHEERFQGVRYRAEVTGAPVLDDAIAYLDCTVARALDAGDHTIFIGLVRASGVQRPEDTPLLYFNGRYYRLGDAATE